MQQEIIDIDTPPQILSTRTRMLLIALRRALIIALLAVEDYLQLPHSVMTKSERKCNEESIDR
jgi:hypothetical protein